MQLATTPPATFTIPQTQQLVDELYSSNGFDSSEWGGGAMITPIPGTSTVAWSSTGKNYLIPLSSAPLVEADVSAVLADTRHAIELLQTDA
jgi:hypothetical protein